MLSVFPGFGVGGAQVRFATVANALGAACRHSIVALNGDTACREKLDPSLDVTFPVAEHRAGRMAASVLQARRFLAQAQPDLVVTSNWGAIEWAAAAKLAGLRHLHTEDGFGPEERSAQLPRRVLTRRVVLRRSDVVLPSRKLLSIATDQWRLPARRLHYVPNGIDLARFAGVTPLPPPEGEGPVIGTVAALRPEKNIARLLRSFAAVRGRRAARLVVVGDGPETEQMPLSLLEAMASGLPATSTDVGDVSEMLAPENRPYVSALDHLSLADALCSLLDSDHAAVGRANRAKAARDYSRDRMVAAYAGLFGIAGAS